ncbi:MAG: DUF2950 family protein, partial [Planctomycetes bacterium]|nr:DUF2950 family protein [Planctomycetota bacterium]
FGLIVFSFITPFCGHLEYLWGRTGNIIIGFVCCSIFIFFLYLYLARIDQSNQVKNKFALFVTIPGILFLVSTIVILCGLLIPGYLLSSGIVKPYYGCGYSSPLSGLRTLLGVEATWRQGDYDRNGIKDYWTYDISGFNRMYRTDGETLVAAIDISFAEADGQSHDDNTFGTDYTMDWSGTFSPTAKAGYRFRAMLRDENGVPYNRNEVGPNKVKATNEDKFAFVAYPDSYPNTGVRTYIISEGGTIYSIDSGSDANKIVLQWPGPGNPTEIKGPGGNYWRVAD